MQEMNSILITSKNKNLREQKALEICNTKKINSLDITYYNRENNKKDIKTSNLSIGIEEIKNLQKNIFYKPIKSIYKASIIQDSQHLTTEAQNALLKILEEPPNNTLIILTADSKELLLPTVLSRCHIIDIPSVVNYDTEKHKEISEQVENLINNDIRYCLYLAEKKSGSKEEALAWLEDVIIILRKKLLASVGKGSEQEKQLLTHYLKMLHIAYQTIKSTNINLRMTLENVFLSIRTLNE